MDRRTFLKRTGQIGVLGALAGTSAGKELINHKLIKEHPNYVMRLAMHTKAGPQRDAFLNWGDYGRVLRVGQYEYICSTPFDPSTATYRGST